MPESLFNKVEGSPQLISAWNFIRPHHMFFSLYSVNILKYVFAMEHTRTATFETEQIENVFVIIILTPSSKT